MGGPADALISSGNILFASRKLPGPVGQLSRGITTIEGEDQMTTYNNSGMAHSQSFSDAHDVHSVPQIPLPRTREHVRFVQLGLMSAPVIPISPPFSQLFDVHGRGTIIPVCAINFVWEASVVKVTLEQGECLLWDGDIKGLLTQNKSWGFGECSGARFVMWGVQQGGQELLDFLLRSRVTALVGLCCAYCLDLDQTGTVSVGAGAASHQVRDTATN